VPERPTRRAVNKGKRPQRTAEAEVGTFRCESVGLPNRYLDGAKLTVTLRDGHVSRLESSAARTRSRDSRTAASGSPTTVKPGSPAETWTSTDTERPSTPWRVAEGIQASMAKLRRWVAQCDRAVATRAGRSKDAWPRESAFPTVGVGCIKQSVLAEVLTTESAHDKAGAGLEQITHIWDQDRDPVACGTR